MAKPTESELGEVLNTEAGFRYRLLSRMQSDCEYAERTNSFKYLWATGDAEKHIEYMKAIWESFPDNEKPDWISLEEINQHAVQMGVAEQRDAQTAMQEQMYGGEGIGGYAYDGMLVITEADIRWKDDGSIQHVKFSLEDSEDHVADSEIFMSGYDKESLLNDDLSKEDFTVLSVGDSYVIDSNGAVYNGKDTVREQPDSLNAKATEAQRACDALKESRDDAGRDAQSFDR